MTPKPITEVLIRKNQAGTGWFVLVNGEARGGLFSDSPIIDPTLVVAEAAKQTAALVLGRDAS